MISVMNSGRSWKPPLNVPNDCKALKWTLNAWKFDSRSWNESDVSIALRRKECPFLETWCLALWSRKFRHTSFAAKHITVNIVEGEVSEPFPIFDRKALIARILSTIHCSSAGSILWPNVWPKMYSWTPKVCVVALHTEEPCAIQYLWRSCLQ